MTIALIIVLNVFYLLVLWCVTQERNDWRNLYYRTREKDHG